MYTKDQIKTMLHRAVNHVIDGWEIPEGETIHFYAYEDADTVEEQLQELVDAVIYLAPTRGYQGEGT